VAGSIIVKHQSVKSWLLLVFFILYGPIKSTHNFSQGVPSASFAGSNPYFFVDYFVL